MKLQPAIEAAEKNLAHAKTLLARIKVATPLLSDAALLNTYVNRLKCATLEIEARIGKHPEAETGD